LATRFELSEIAWLARLFSEIDYKIRHSSYAHLPFEVALVEGILHRPDAKSARPTDAQQTAVAASHSQPARSSEPPTRDEDLLSRPPTTALRDRVRGTAPRNNPTSIRETATESVDRLSDAPAQVTSPSPSPAQAPTPIHTNGALTRSVEQLIDLWPRIRLDVKAVNRRIEALLSSIDPVDVRGNEVILAAAYPFHRDRMNSDEVRVIVDEAISKVLQRPVTSTCVLRGETPIVCLATKSASLQPHNHLHQYSIPKKMNVAFRQPRTSSMPRSSASSHRDTECQSLHGQPPLIAKAGASAWLRSRQLFGGPKLSWTS
jgi:DNA polymerase-3 subunit gamma/tau